MSAKRKIKRKVQPERKPRVKQKTLPVATMAELRELTETIALKQSEYNHKFAIAMVAAKMPIATTAVCFDCLMARPRNQPCGCSITKKLPAGSGSGRT